MLGQDTLPALLRAAAEQFGDHLAYVEGARALSYADLLERVEATAAAYVEAGVTPGDRVRALGTEQHRLGDRRARGVVRGRRCWYRSTRAMSAPRWPTWSIAPAPALVIVHDGFLGRDQVRRAQPRRRDRAESRPDRRPSSTKRRLADFPDDVPRRRRRHPVHLRHHRPVQGRDERAPADHRGRAGLGRARWRAPGRPLPGGQPVLPLVRLQDRDRRRAAHRLHPLPGGDVRRRRDDAAHRVGADHGLPGRTDALPVAARRAHPRRARPVVAAARGDRRRRRTGRADRADARRAAASTRSSRRSA